MSYRSFSPFPGPFPDYSHASSYCQHIDSPFVNEYPHPDSSFSNLQDFCNMAREASVASPSISSSYYTGFDEQSVLSEQLANEVWGTPTNQPPHPSEIQNQWNYAEGILGENSEDGEDQCQASYYGDDDDEADWFDLEALGLSGLDGSPTDRFDYPVPSYPVLTEELVIGHFSGHEFYMDNEGFVQVYTEGECYKAFVDKPSIGVWFGPNHEMNVSERIHRGRRTLEAAQFAAVIEAIKVAGSCGIKKLQINTGYINILQFMMYFILKWENNSWMTIRGTAVKNQGLIRELDYFSRLLDIKWNYIPYEENAEGIEQAYELARDALALNLPKSQKRDESNENGPSSSTVQNEEAMDTIDQLNAVV